MELPYSPPTKMASITMSLIKIKSMTLILTIKSMTLPPTVIAPPTKRKSKRKQKFVLHAENNNKDTEFLESKSNSKGAEFSESKSNSKETEFLLA